MRYILAILCLCFALATVVSAQSYPRAEVFGGYSYLRVDTQGVSGASLDAECNLLLGAGTCPPGTFGVHPALHGWNASAQVNVNRRFGVKADMSGHYGTPVTLSADAIAFFNSLGISGLPPKANSFSYLFGPVVSQRLSRYTVFGHALVGANRAGVNVHIKVNQVQIPAVTVSNTAIAMAFGGGVDVNISPHFALRGQADYLYTRHDFSTVLPGIATHQNNVRASAGIVYRFGGTTDVGSAPRQTIPSVGMNIPALGITVSQGRNHGAEITAVVPGSVAALASLHAGDVVNSIGGKPVATPSELAAELANHAPGDQIKIGYMIRGQWQAETTIVLGNH